MNSHLSCPPVLESHRIPLALKIPQINRLKAGQHELSPTNSNSTNDTSGADFYSESSKHSPARSDSKPFCVKSRFGNGFSSQTEMVDSDGLKSPPPPAHASINPFAQALQKPDGKSIMNRHSMPTRMRGLENEGKEDSILGLEIREFFWDDAFENKICTFLDNNFIEIVNPKECSAEPTPACQLRRLAHKSPALACREEGSNLLARRACKKLTSCHLKVDTIIEGCFSGGLAPKEDKNHKATMLSPLILRSSLSPRHRKTC